MRACVGPAAAHQPPDAARTPGFRTTEQQLEDLEREEYEAKLREEIARRRAERGLS